VDEQKPEDESKNDPSILRMDGPYENVFLNVGNRGDRNAYTRATTPRLLQWAELENLYEGDGFARRIIDIPADEMVRAGYDIEGIEDEHAVKAELEGIQMLPKLALALRWSGLYGGSLIVMLINDDGTLEEPLNINRVRELEQLRVYDRWQVSRHEKYLDPADRRFGQTKIYQVSPVEGMPYFVHESRCIALDGVAVPDRLRERNDGWGDSKLQQCYTQLERLGMSHYWANALMERAQQGIHGIPDLTGLLRSPGGEELVKRRINLVDMARSINNTVVIDKEESYDLKSSTMSGIADIIDRLGLALSAVSGMPESLLFGRPQSGLNSTGKSDLEYWYASIKQRQETILLPAIDRIVTIQLHAMNAYVEDYSIEFEPLTVPSAKEEAETDYTVAKTYEIYANIGALDASEIRKELADDGYQVQELDLPGELEEIEPPEPPEPAAPTPAQLTEDALKKKQLELLDAEIRKLDAEAAAAKDNAAAANKLLSGDA